VTFTDELLEFATPAWNRYVEHPFFEAAAAATLPLEKFRFWLIQDLPYVVEYGRFRTRYAEQVAEDPRYSDIMTAERKVIWPGADEGEFLIETLKRLGVAEPNPDRFAARPAREGFMNHIARAVYEGDPAEGIAAIIPCDWGFTVWTGRLAASKSGDVHPVIADWVDKYATDDHAANTGVSRALLDRGGELADDRQRERIKLVFLRSLQHQIEVVDAAWSEYDPWPEEITVDDIISWRNGHEKSVP
jgi:thiaminase/transcriptional activator TenA